MSSISGLFHRAISQSGTGLSSWAYAEPEYMRGAAFNIGAKIGCDSTNANDLLQCFRKKPAEDFIDVFGYEVSNVQLPMHLKWSYACNELCWFERNRMLIIEKG
jgi:carboxylesterase type B